MRSESESSQPVQPEVTDTVGRVFREELGRIVAHLLRFTGNWDLAEEARRTPSRGRSSAGRATACPTGPVPG